jgi:hypothetical protein
MEMPQPQTVISPPFAARTAGGMRFSRRLSFSSSEADALALAQTRSGGLPVQEEYSLAFTAFATGPGYASSEAMSQAQIIA